LDVPTDHATVMQPAAMPHPHWTRRQWLAWGLLPLLGLALALGLQKQPPQREFFIGLNQWATACPSALWVFFTLLGETDVLLVFLSPLLLWRPQAMMAVVAAIPVGGLFSVILKSGFNAPRPGAVLDASQFHLIGPLLSNHSFPSGHSITAFAAVAAVLTTVVTTCAAQRTKPSPLWATLVIGMGLTVAMMVGFSRVAVGAHWPVDVLAGASGGWLAGMSGAWVARRFPALWQSERHQRWLGGLLLMLAAWLLWRPVDYPQGVLAVWLAAGCAVLTGVGQLRAWLKPVVVDR